MESRLSVPGDGRRYSAGNRIGFMLTYRYSLRSLLLAIAVVSAYFPIAGIYQKWFATKYSGYHVGVLASGLRNGDSVSEVSKHFDSTRLLTASDESEMKNVAYVWGSNKWTIENEDQFFHFSAPGGHSANLQFRGGKLVNHQINAYNDARKLAELNNYSLPHPLLPGVWPFYLVFVVFTWVLYSLFFRDRRPEHDGSSVRVGANIGTDTE